MCDLWLFFMSNDHVVCLCVCLCRTFFFQLTGYFWMPIYLSDWIMWSHLSLRHTFDAINWNKRSSWERMKKRRRCKCWWSRYWAVTKWHEWTLWVLKIDTTNANRIHLNSIQCKGWVWQRMDGWIDGSDWNLSLYLRSNSFISLAFHSHTSCNVSAFLSFIIGKIVITKMLIMWIKMHCEWSVTVHFVNTFLIRVRALER